MFEAFQLSILFISFTINLCVTCTINRDLILNRWWRQWLQTRAVVQRLVQRSTETSAHAGRAEATGRHQGQMKKGLWPTAATSQDFFFLFNAFSRFKPTSERLRWPPVHRADLPAAVWVCSGSAEDQQGHGAAEKWDEKILPDYPVNTPTTEGWRNSFLLSSPQPLTTSTFSTKKRRSRRRRFQCYGRKWWRWRSWKRELMDPLIVAHHHIVASLVFVLHGGRFKMLIWDWKKIDCEPLIAEPDTLGEVL